MFRFVPVLFFYFIMRPIVRTAWSQIERNSSSGFHNQKKKSSVSYSPIEDCGTFRVVTTLSWKLAILLFITSMKQIRLFTCYCLAFDVKMSRDTTIYTIYDWKCLFCITRSIIAKYPKSYLVYGKPIYCNA